MMLIYIQRFRAHISETSMLFPGYTSLTVAHSEELGWGTIRTSTGWWIICQNSNTLCLHSQRKRWKGGQERNLWLISSPNRNGLLHSPLLPLPHHHHGPVLVTICTPTLKVQTYFTLFTQDIMSVLFSSTYFSKFTPKPRKYLKIKFSKIPPYMLNWLKKSWDTLKRSLKIKSWTRIKQMIHCIDQRLSSSGKLPLTLLPSLECGCIINP